MNPMARVFAALIGVLALAGAFFFGLIILAVVVGLGLLAWFVIRLRIWWIMRQMTAEEPTAPPSSSQGEAIDAEYTVVSKKQDS